MDWQRFGQQLLERDRQSIGQLQEEYGRSAAFFQTSFDDYRECGKNRIKKETAIDEDLFKADGLNKVGDIVNQDPKLRAAVDEIMAGNSQKSEQRAH